MGHQAEEGQGAHLSFQDVSQKGAGQAGHLSRQGLRYSEPYRGLARRRAKIAYHLEGLHRKVGGVGVQWAACWAQHAAGLGAEEVVAGGEGCVALHAAMELREEAGAGQEAELQVAQEEIGVGRAAQPSKAIQQ